MAANSTETVPSSGSPRPARLRRALDTLGVKLFLAIAGANLVLVMAVYLGYSKILDQGLVDYVNESDQARLRPIVDELADGYHQHGSWEWLAQDRETWGALLGKHLGFGNLWMFRDQRNRDNRNGNGPRDDRSKLNDQRAPSRPPAGEQPGGPPPRDNPALRPDRGFPHVENPVALPITIDWRIMLFDGTGKSVGPFPFDAKTLGQAVKLPITVNGSIVGYLGYIPQLTVVETLESYAKQQQAKRFLVIAIGMLAAVLLNAALISHWLSRRLRALGHGAAALARGDYTTRIPATGYDELARLAGDFNHLALALGAAQRGRQQWIADIAHELRTPLTSLRAEVEAVQDGVRPLTQGSIASVAQEVNQLTRLVEDLRMLSLSDLGALTCRKEPEVLAEIIDDAMAAGRVAITEKNLQLRTSIDQSLVVEADAERLAQVFANLLQNTLRYTEAPARLSITATIDGANARIDWDDSAPGVGDADLPRLTERLYRVDESRARVSGGSGLGLAIVKAIIDAHGGRMQASHSPLGGLRWSIWLPLSES